MTRRPLPSPRAFWFPASYVAHATEEYCCGETFPVWISRLAHVQFTATAFLWLNGIALGAMVAAAWFATHHERLRLLITTLATIVTINGTAHVIGSIATASYSPGVVTGAICWLPLGVVTLRRSRHELTRGAFATGIAFGVFAHAVVSAIVITS
ncbi:MAG: HXXEE domain-containing protein [Planctomycetes bacterium]|nr:HXXEE domain-containing protein [Planctomycetota bacterium]